MATFNVKALAEAIDTDGRTLRKFLRATTPTDEHPGKGGRWALDLNKNQVNALQKKFTAWNDARRAADGADEVDAPAE